MNKLLIVGSVAFDAIETPFGKTNKILGGAAPFIGLSAAFFNIQSAIVSVVGEDFPQEYLDLLTARNIDISGIEVIKGGKTFFWSGKYHNDMNSRDTLVTELNVLGDFNPIVPKDFKNADVVMLGNLHPKVQSGVLDQLETKPKLIVLDTMNFWMDCALEDLLNTIKRVDVITINDEEARQLSGEYSLVKAAAKIQSMASSLYQFARQEVDSISHTLNWDGVVTTLHIWSVHEEQFPQLWAYVGRRRASGPMFECAE